MEGLIFGILRYFNNFLGLSLLLDSLFVRIMSLTEVI